MVPALLLAACLAAAGASRARAQTLLNGSFELPALTDGDDARGAGNNWVSTGTNFIETNGEPFFGDTPYGNQYLDNSSGATASQTIATGFAMDARYHLSLVVAALFDAGQTLSITISGAATASQSFDIAANPNPTGALPFVTVAVDFTTTVAGPVTITLGDISTDGNALAIDNVALLAVPEPSAWVMALSGLGLLGGIRRLRCARRA